MRDEKLPAVNLTGDQFEQLLAALKANPSPSEDTATAMKAIEALVASQKSIEKIYQRQVRHSNATHPNVSAFTFDPRCEPCKTGTPHDNGELAHPKAKLAHEVYFCHGLIRDDEATVVEAELLNAFTEDMSCRDGLWSATFVKKGKGKQELHIMVPFLGSDVKMGLPSFEAILAELLYGNKVVNPALAMAAMADMQKRIDQLEARLAVNA